MARETRPKRLHMIGNAHIDLVWLWQWQEGFQEAKSTLRSALDRTSEFDQFLFTTSTVAVLEWLETHDPQLFEEVRARVAEGRWEIAGGWWVQPDCNIPCGESFVRQGLYGQRFLQEKFGVTAKTAYNVDSFGHTGMLPQIFKKSGMDNYVMMRPMSQEKGLPSHLFWWEADDGSRVKCFRILYEYLSWGQELSYHIERCGAEISERLPEIMCFYGVGNHGGGPTVENIRSIQAAQKQPRDYDIVFSTPTRYFQSVAALGDTLPVVHGELLHHSVGCYSAQSEIKRLNRTGENRLLAAEKFALAAKARAGMAWPENFAEAWKRLLFNQFHDTLAGTSLAAAYEDARHWGGAAICAADENLNNALQALSWRVDIPYEEDMQPLVVFNPVCRAMKVPVSLEVSGTANDGFTLVDAEGRPVPVQQTPSAVQVEWRTRVAFMADLPAYGYATYRLYKNKPGAKKARQALKATDSQLENERFLLEFDKKTGYIKRFYDKEQAYEIFSGDAAVPVVLEDDTDTWSHDAVRFDAPAGAFKAKSVRLVNKGPVSATVQVISEYETSRLVQNFTMYAGSQRVDVLTKVRWNESRKVLKLAFPVRSTFNKHCCETAFGYTERGNTGDEYPVQSWMDATGVTGDKGALYGFALLNDGKYAASIHKKNMMLTVLRSPAYAHHNPVALDDGTEYDYVDQGVQQFTYALYPHAGKWEDSDLEAQAQSLNQPPLVTLETFHAGPLPQRDAFISVASPAVQVSAIKQAEDGDGVVLRLYESHKTWVSTQVVLPLWQRELALEFAPCEVKTLYIPYDSAKAVREVLLTEYDLPDGQAEE